jgi:hypothetical protein
VDIAIATGFVVERLGTSYLITNWHVVTGVDPNTRMLLDRGGRRPDTVRNPEHFAMVFVGLVTGLRPSSLRPLRRRGPTPDVLWDQRQLRVRRSQTVGDEVMRTTKQRPRYIIDLPEKVMGVLRWHVDTQLRTPEQQDSDLLFPSRTGGVLSRSALDQPFAPAAFTCSGDGTALCCGFPDAAHVVARGKLEPAPASELAPGDESLALMEPRLCALP